MLLYVNLQQRSYIQTYYTNICHQFNPRHRPLHSPISRPTDQVTVCWSPSGCVPLNIAMCRSLATSQHLSLETEQGRDGHTTSKSSIYLAFPYRHLIITFYCPPVFTHKYKACSLLITVLVHWLKIKINLHNLNSGMTYEAWDIIIQQLYVRSTISFRHMH